jgi:YidC/Oxa1 family membrane protein insertase
MSIEKFPKEELSHNSRYESEVAIPYDYTPSETFAMQMYLGPNHYNTLKKFKIGLEDQIDLGPFFLISWINKGVIVVFNAFQKMHLSYGLIILLLTLIIKLITSPVTYRTFVSSSKMRLLKPDVDELAKKFKPGEEIQKQQATMQLYRRAGVSPLAGCIPALLQMPILLAMFSFFPAAVELRQQGFLWAEDFSTYDSILQLPFSIPFYGNHVSLFTLLMTATTLIYTWMSSGQMASGTGAQARQMKIMMYVMPIVFLGVLNNYSAALSYYYFLSNLISILLMLVIRNFLVDEKKLHAILEENKKRPEKKSKWAERLAEMQKVREQQVRQQQKGGGNKPGGNKPKKK